MEKKNNGIIIMAGGLGKRMKSTLPKVLHPLCGIPMLIRIIRKAKELKPKKILIVVGKYKNIIEETIIKWENNMNGLEFVIQEPANGTGHAIQCCVNSIKKNNLTQVLILNGDNPLIKKETMKSMFYNLSGKKCCIMISYFDNPHGCGRIILDNKKLIKIVEEKDCNNEQKNINLVNCGVYAFKSNILINNIMKLKNNNSQNEYYLTDLMEIIKDNENCDINYIIHPKDKQYELIGVNTKEALEQLELDTIYNNWL